MTERRSLYEEKIVRFLYKYNRPMTIAELSKKTGIAWATVQSCLHKLEEEGVVFRQNDDKEYWLLDE